MHEAGIALNLIEAVQQRLADESWGAVPPGDAAPGGGSVPRVAAIHVRVGELAGVSTEALDFAFECLSANTTLRGARLVFDPVPLTVHCEACGQTTRVEDLIFRCGACGSERTRVASGRELEVRTLELEEGAVAGARD